MELCQEEEAKGSNFSQNIQIATNAFKLYTWAKPNKGTLENGAKNINR